MTKDEMQKLRIGDEILFTGTIYTARDAAHQRIAEMIENNEKLPVDFSNSLIYYAGPTPTKPGTIMGSIGPTTSSRMDKFAKMMKKLGVIATIGKGPRSLETVNQYYRDNILYFITTGGIGALLSKCVTKYEEIAFQDLGPESIKRLEVKDFPLILAIDSTGSDLFRRK